MRRATAKENRALQETPGSVRWMPVAHVFGLWAFAVAQPILDLVGREPGFLLAHRLTGLPLAALALGLALGLPLLLATPLALPTFRHNRVGRLWADGVRTLLAGAFLLQLLHWLPGPAALALAVAGGASTVFLLRRHSGFSALFAITAVAAVVSPVVFLLRPGVRGLVPTTSESNYEPVAAIAEAPEIEADVPIVFLVFDELPTSSIQLPDGSINGHRYPSFADLAASSDWYSRATTTAIQTDRAIPTLLTGKLAQREGSAHYRDHPANLFTWLGRGGYRIVAYEAFGLLCPPTICAGPPPTSPWERLTAAADDLSVVYGHLLLPPTLRTGLPDVNQTWTEFRHTGRAGEDATDTGGRGLHQDVARVVESFLSRMEHHRSGRPTFYYLHLNLPHVPWRYLPSGREYVPIGAPVVPAGIDGPLLPVEEWPTVQALQRHLLQVGYADRVLGQILDRLRSTELYDRALIVATADHGCSFRPGVHRRAVSEANVEDQLEVPLFVKRPGQSEGTIRNHAVRTIDIVPTIAGTLGAEPPWEVDGTRLADTSPREVIACCYPPPASPSRSIPTDPERRRETLDRLDQLFGDGTVDDVALPPPTSATGTRGAQPTAATTPDSPDPFDGVFAAGPRPDLLGSRVADFSSENNAEGSPTHRVLLTAPHSYNDVRPDSGFVPSLITGRLEPGAADGTRLAVAVDGIVRATTETLSHRGVSQFSALVHERWLPAGSHQIGVHAIDGAPRGDGRTILRRLSGIESPPRLLTENGRVQGVALPGGELIRRANGLFRMKVEVDSTSFRGFLIHAPDEPPPALDEFFVFDGSTLLFRGEDDRVQRHERTRGDGQIEITFRIFIPAAIVDRAESLRVLAKSGDQLQDVSPSTYLPGMFEMLWSDQGRVNALLRRPMNLFDAEPERLEIVSSRDGIVGFLGAQSEDSATVPGWVTDLGSPGSTLEVVAFLAGRQIWVDNVRFPRRDVVRRYGPEHRTSGFKLFDPLRVVPGSRNELAAEDTEALRREGVLVYAISPRGISTRVRFQYRPLLSQTGDLEVLPVTDGRLLTVRPPGDGFDGAIDLVTKPGNRTLIEGWAADLERREAPRQLVIYRDGKFLTDLGANRERPDIVEHHGDERLLRTGFGGRVPGAPEPQEFADRHRVFAIMLRGAAVELQLQPGAVATNPGSGGADGTPQPK